jgi:hypothetical protein
MIEDDYKTITEALDALYAYARDNGEKLRSIRTAFLQTNQLALALGLRTRPRDANLPRDARAEHLARKIERIMKTAASFNDTAEKLEAILVKWRPYILNGTPTKGDYRECVAVESMGLDYECSGVVVHPKWIITSSHCTSPSKVFIGDDIYDTVYGLNEFAVVDRGIAKGSVGNVRVVEVIGMLPNPIVAVVAAACSFENVDATIVGFGLDSVAGVFGTKRAGRVKIVKSDPDIVTTPNPDDVCAGDSGGPLVAEENGVNIVVGIIEETLKVNCGAGGVYTRLDRSIVDAIEKITQVRIKTCVR